MRTIITLIPEPDDDLTGIPDDWELGRRLELHHMHDDRYPGPTVVAKVVVTRVDREHDGTRHLHLANADPGECS